MSDCPVEFTAKYATSVLTLAEAWGFVMDHIEKVGPEPRIEISPYTLFEDDEKYSTVFEVCVSGMVEQ